MRDAAFVVLMSRYCIESAGKARGGKSKRHKLNLIRAQQGPRAVTCQPCTNFINLPSPVSAGERGNPDPLSSPTGDWRLVCLGLVIKLVDSLCDSSACNAASFRGKKAFILSISPSLLLKKNWKCFSFLQMTEKFFEMDTCWAHGSGFSNGTEDEDEV